MTTIMTPSAAQRPSKHSLLREHPRWVSITGTLGFVAVTGGWGMVAESCCERHACEQIRFLNGQIAGGYAACCQAPAAQQDACFTELNAKVSATQTLILSAKIACDNNDDAAIRDIIKQIRELWLPKIIKTAAGLIQNQMVAFGDRDWIVIDTTLPRNIDCKPVTVSVVNNKIVNPESTGKATEEARSATPGAGGLESVTVLPSNAAQTFTACEYSLVPNTTLDLRFGNEWNNISLSGSISIAQTAQFPAAGSADIGLPTEVSLTATKLGQKLSLELDKTSPFNTLRVDAAGIGTLGVALTLSSDSSALIGLVQVGSTIYFELPVVMSADWSALRIVADAITPGSTITPTVPVILIGSDSPPRPGIAQDRCADNDENGLRDGADEVIYAINSQLNCQTAAQQH